MSRRAVTRGCALALLGACAAAAAVSGLSTGQGTMASRSSQQQPAGAVAVSAGEAGARGADVAGRAVEGTEPPNPPAGRRERRRARRAAQRFLRAFLAYQHGDLSGSVRRVLGETAAPRLARTLLAHPVRSIAGHEDQPGALRRLRVHGPFGGELKASALIAYAGGEESLIELVLSPGPEGHRVTELQP